MIIFTQRVSLLAHSLSVACCHVAHLNDTFSLKMLGISKAWTYEKLRLSQLKHLDSKSLEKVVCWKPPKICFLNKKCLLRKKDWHPCFVIRSSNNNSNKINNNINKTTSTTSSAQVFDWKHLNKDVADIRSGGLSRVVTNLTFSDFLLEWSSSFTPDISCLNNSLTLSLSRSFSLSLSLSLSVSLTLSLTNSHTHTFTTLLQSIFPHIFNLSVDIFFWINHIHSYWFLLAKNELFFIARF